MFERRLRQALCVGLSLTVSLCVAVLTETDDIKQETWQQAIKEHAQ